MVEEIREMPKVDGFVKSRILPFNWILAFAGMTISKYIPDRYDRRHTREGGYPGAKMTFYDFIKVRFIAISSNLTVFFYSSASREVALVWLYSNSDPIGHHCREL